MHISLNQGDIHRRMHAHASNPVADRLTGNCRNWYASPLMFVAVLLSDMLCRVKAKHRKTATARFPAVSDRDAAHNIHVLAVISSIVLCRATHSVPVE